MFCKNRGSVKGALILIIIGMLFLLDNFNLIPGGMWSMLGKLWPMLLIIPGILILVRNK